MANFDFKTAVPDTNIAGTEYWFGADSQSAATPSIYSIGGLKTYLLGGGSLAITAAKTLTATSSLTLTGTDGTTMTFPSSSATLAGLGIANLFTTAQTISPVTDVTALTARSSAGGTSNILQLQDSSNNVLAAFDSSGLLTLGRGSGLTGQLKFSNSTNNNLVTLQAGTTSGNITFTLPTADGTSGQVLQTNGSGVLSWKTDATNSPGGLDTQVQFNNSGAFGADSTLTFNSTSKLLSAQRFGLSGNISSAAWTTNGIRYSNSSATITDTSSSGTVATAYTNVYGGNTIAASNSTTFTNYYNTFIAAPVSGTNVTFTNAWALGLGGNLKLGPDAFGTNQAGTNTTIGASCGTGNAAGGNLLFQISPAGSSGSNANALSTLLSLTGTNRVGIFTASPSYAIDVAFNSQTNAASTMRFYNSNSRGTAQFWLAAPTSNDGFPVIQFNNDTTNKVTVSLEAVNWKYISGSSQDDLAITCVNSVNFACGANLAAANNSPALRITSSNLALYSDVILSRRGTANLRLGAADAAAPVAQILSVQSVVAGESNKAGANFTITGSQGTGTGAGGSIIFQVAPAGSSGTSQNALATAMTILGSGNIGLGTVSNPTVRLTLNSTGLLGWDTGSNASDIVIERYNPGLNISANSASDTSTALRIGSKVGLPNGSYYGVYGVNVGLDNLFTGARASTVNLCSLYVGSTTATTYDFAFWLGNSSGRSEVLTIKASNFNVGILTSSPTNTLSFGGNSARTIWMERHTTSNTAGNDLTVQAGGATSGATDKNGGNLILSAATSTGTGSSAIIFNTATAAGSTGTSDNAPSEKMRITGAGLLTFAGTTSSFPALKRSSTILQTRLADDSDYAPLEASTVRVAKAYTVATLPAAGTAGRMAYVTDATAPTYLGALTGGGAVVCPVFDNGTAWVSH